MTPTVARFVRLANGFRFANLGQPIPAWVFPPAAGAVRHKILDLVCNFVWRDEEVRWQFDANRLVGPGADLTRRSFLRC